MKTSVKNVFDRGLVSENVKPKDIINEYVSYSELEVEVKNFPAFTLAYVTPVSYFNVHHTSELQ